VQTFTKHNSKILTKYTLSLYMYVCFLCVSVTPFSCTCWQRAVFCKRNVQKIKKIFNCSTIQVTQRRLLTADPHACIKPQVLYDAMAHVYTAVGLGLWELSVSCSSSATTVMEDIETLSKIIPSGIPLAAMPVLAACSL